MIEVPILTTDRPHDFQQVRVETVSLVNAASNATSGLGEAQAGVYVVLPAQNLPENHKAFSRIFFISPAELVRNSLDEAAIGARLHDVLKSTPIRYDAKRKQYTFLDVHCLHFEAAVRRVVETIMVAGQNFRRDTGELIMLYDGFTQPSLKLPVCTAFHAQAAFANLELFNTYRSANGMPQSPPPTVTPEIRKMLARFGVSAPAIPDRGAPVQESFAQGLMSAALPSGPAALQQAAQGNAYGKEVQMIMHVLGAAIVAGEIQPLVMNDQFRSALAKAVDGARTATYAQTAQENLLNIPHA